MVNGHGELAQQAIQNSCKELTINNLQLTINIHRLAFNQNWHGFRQRAYWKPA